MMRKMIYLMVMMTLFVASANAQTYWGHLTRNVNGYVNVRKGEGVMYQKTRNGKIQLEGAAEYVGAYSPDIVKFSGYYIGEIIDPVDNYVNVRKGPGTNYPVVRKVHTKAWCGDRDRCGHPTDSGRFFYQKTSSNWWKLYDAPGKFVGYIYYNRLEKDVCPEYY